MIQLCLCLCGKGYKHHCPTLPGKYEDEDILRNEKPLYLFKTHFVVADHKCKLRVVICRHRQVLQLEDK